MDEVISLKKEEYKNRLFFLFSLLMIAITFLFSGFITYRQFSKNLIDNEFSSQKRLSFIINQLLIRYFYTIKFITQNTSIQPEFNYLLTKKEDEAMYKKINGDTATELIHKYNINNVLISKKSAVPINSPLADSILKKEVYFWQVFKALPPCLDGNSVAENRRERARTILKTYNDIHYVFQMKSNGDLIFLEPFSVQKNITDFNYGFRDYLHLAKSYRSTAISEGYISNDKEDTQIITVASPIFSGKKVTSIFAASLSAKTLREKVFMQLAKNIGVSDGTVFYLIDRHGHVVASSDGRNIYFPTRGNKEDSKDQGNIRNLAIFNNISWYKDSFEKGNVLWGRDVFSWNESSLKKLYQTQYKNADRIEVVGTLLPTSLGGKKINWAILIETPVNSILAYRNTLKKMFFYCGLFLFFILITLFYFTLRAFKKLEKKIIDKEEEIKRVSSQVAHDIRSPLVALDMLLENLGAVDEEKRVVVRQSVNRINDIANKLVIKHGARKNDDINPEILFILIDEIVNEKQILCVDRDISFIKEYDSYSYELCAIVNATDFKRAISNIINNSIESIDGPGIVTVSLYQKLNNVIISINDTGCGMDENTVQNIIDGKIKSSKENGNGLGLPFAISVFNSWGYKLEIESFVGKGTTIKICMLASEPPKWLRRKLNIVENGEVIILDDDESIHGVWTQRLKDVCSENNITIMNFKDPESIIQYVTTSKKENSTYLIDYELLGFEKNGLDVIEELRIESQATLVTSYYNNDVVRDRCNKMKVKSIPKNYSLYIPFEIIISHPDAILIDDNVMIHKVWKMKANEKGLHVVCFSNTTDFMQTIYLYSKDTKIYVDSDMGSDLKGESFAKLLVLEYDFKNVYITTAFDNGMFKGMRWLTGVISKEPPY